MSKSGVGECRGMEAMGSATRSSGRTPRSEERDEQLLPGIPNEITLDHITTKLPWSALRVLSIVCRAWKEATRSRSVYDARVRSHTTETLVVHNHGLDDNDETDGQARICLYSITNNCCYELPPIPYWDTGIPWLCQSISLDGKIYVVGGMSNDREYSRATKKVFVLDVAGQGQWKQCASMQNRRMCFQCGVMGGRIYVFKSLEACQSEVYDPMSNAWSPIRPRSSPTGAVATFGEGLLVDGGIVSEKDVALNPQDEALFLEVYNPSRDEWTVVSPYYKSLSSRRLFRYKGKIFMITADGIYVHNSENNSWRHLHTNLFPDVDSCCAHPYAAVIVEDELIIGARWHKDVDETGQTRLLHSKGLCGENKEIVWQEANCPSHTEASSYMCTIEL